MNKESHIKNMICSILFFVMLTALLIISFRAATRNSYKYITKGPRLDTGEIANGIIVTQEIPCNPEDIGLSFIFTTYGHQVIGDVFVQAAGDTSDFIYFNKTIDGKQFKNNEYIDFMFENNRPLTQETITVQFSSNSIPANGISILTTDDDSLLNHALTINGNESSFDIVTRRITRNDHFIFWWIVFTFSIVASVISAFILIRGTQQIKMVFYKAADFIIIMIWFELLIYHIHSGMGIISDDAVNAAMDVNWSNVATFIKGRFFSNGKFITDGLAFLLYCLPFNTWKLIDTLIYGVLLFLLWYMFTDHTNKMLFLSSVFLVLFPISQYMSSAGYINTTTVYVYTIVGLLLGILPVVMTSHSVHTHSRIHTHLYLLSIFGLIYTSNQDQTGIIAIGFFFMTGLLNLYKWKIEHKVEYQRLFKLCSIYFISSLILYILSFMTPGHLNRMKDTGEMMFWLPEYANWSFFYKVYKGISTTFANIFFLQPTVFQFYCVVLLILVFILKREYVIFPAILNSILLSIRILDQERFIIYHSYSCGLPDLIPPDKDPSAILLSLIIFLLLIASVLSLWKPERDLCIYLIILNILGFGSRFMMGFSATIYASSYRTFTAQLFTFIIGEILLSNRIIYYIEKK
ncbi:MAG: hypothetical protein IJI41_03225 [Anaerolineaceae bacterium]|nr:hypothetical protein [Anaerolineaceae bacterium]